jgi:hypothetical protein
MSFLIIKNKMFKILVSLISAVTADHVPWDYGIKFETINGVNTTIYDYPKLMAYATKNVAVDQLPKAILDWDKISHSNIEFPRFGLKAKDGTITYSN